MGNKRTETLVTPLGVDWAFLQTLLPSADLDRFLFPWGCLIHRGLPVYETHRNKKVRLCQGGLTAGQLTPEASSGPTPPAAPASRRCVHRPKGGAPGIIDVAGLNYRFRDGIGCGLGKKPESQVPLTFPGAPLAKQPGPQVGPGGEFSRFGPCRAWLSTRGSKTCLGMSYSN